MDKIVGGVFNARSLALIIPLIVQVLPIVIDAVGKMEDLIKGIKRGAVKKVKAMELIEKGLDAKNLLMSLFGLKVDSSDARVMAIADRLVDLVVFIANIFGFFETSVRLDTRPKQSPSESGSIRFWELYGYLLFIAIGILLGVTMLTSCAWFGPKVYKTSNYVEYDGPIQNNRRFSDDMIRIYNETLECAGVNIPIPPPNVKVLGCPEFSDCDTDGVMCGDKIMAGCYESFTNTVVLPANTTANVISHEYLHHFINHVPDLLGSDIESQEQHKSELFDKCAGNIKLQ